MSLDLFAVDAPQLKAVLIATGIAGTAAAMLVGTGEFLLHYDDRNRYADGPQYMSSISRARANAGHFISALSVPFYIAGILHLFLMTMGAGLVWSALLAAILIYSFIVAAIWMGSRATLHAIVSGRGADDDAMLALYKMRYETLINFVRIGVLLASVIFVWQICHPATPYPLWMMAANPALLILASFALWKLVPSIGKYLMPIALNVSFFILYGLSTLVVLFTPAETLARLLVRSAS